MPSLEGIDNDIPAETARQTYVFVADINAITMAPTDPSDDTYCIHDNIPKEATLRILVDVIIYQEDEGAEARQE